MASEIQRRTLVGAAGLFMTNAAAQQPTEVRKSPMKLAIGSDHAGFPMKGPIIEILKSWGHTVKDCGSYTPEPVDFPAIAAAVCAEVKTGRAKSGIMVCGNGG